MTKLKTYYINPDDEENIVTRISLVEEPAMESSMVYFKKDKPLYVAMDSDEQKLVYAPVIIPDKEIYRRYGDEEFNVVFTKEAVKMLAHDFIKNGLTREWSLNHDDEKTPGMYTVESWLKTDMENDKSISLGLDKDLPVGTWFAAMKVENPAVWENIKKGVWDGFSIEAYLAMDEEPDESKFDNNNQTKNNKEDMSKNFNEDTFFEKVKGLFESYFNKEKLEDEAPAAEETVEEVIEEKVDEVIEEVEEVAETPEEAADGLQEIVDALQDRVDELVEEVEVLKKQNQKLSRQPSTKEVKANAQQKRGSSRDVIEALYNGTYFSK